MKRTNVVIASVLKPVDDTRMYEKFARTLSSLPGYYVHIIGYQADHHPEEENIRFHPIFNFSRLSFRRFAASFNYYKNLLKLKPDIVIVNTTDLLIVTCLYKILFGAEILYDVQENYKYNSLYTEKFRRPLNYIIGYFVRAVEWMSAPFIRHFILAEQTYQYELPFIGNRFTIIENKFEPPSGQGNSIHSSRNKKSIYHLLYSGTIAESYGIFDAIELAIRFHQADSRFHLTIIGYCADAKVFAKVSEKIQPHYFIRLVGGDRLVPHSTILRAIQEADIGIIAYHNNKSTKNRIPTKLNEYMYYKLPFILADNPIWVAYCSPYESCIAIDYASFDERSIIYQLYNASFYKSDFSIDQLLWIYEKNKLISLVHINNTTLFSKKVR